MILNCPKCSSRFHVDAALLGPDGRMVRCANCSHRWRAKPPADAPKVVELSSESPTPSTTEPKAAASAPVAAAATADQSKSLINWLAGALVVLVLASAVIGRHEIVAAFPASAPIYESLGLSARVTEELGLQFRSVTSEWKVEDGASVLMVGGDVVNGSEQNRAVPPIRISILDGDGQELQHELILVNDSTLAPGTKTSFAGRVIDPAEQGKNFRLTFDMDTPVQF